MLFAANLTVRHQYDLSIKIACLVRISSRTAHEPQWLRPDCHCVVPVPQIDDSDPLGTTDRSNSRFEPETANIIPNIWASPSVSEPLVANDSDLCRDLDADRVS